MLHKQPSSVPSHVQVRFELPACIWADRIFLVGDFNQWKMNTTQLKQGRDGIWRAVLELPAGRRFTFRYWIDGKWQTDGKADGFAADPAGKEASVVDTAIVPSIPVKTIYLPDYLPDYLPESSPAIKPVHLSLEVAKARDVVLS